MKEVSLIILDLNGLLIDRDYARGKPAKDFEGIIIGDHVVAPRIGALEFVDELAKTFKVALWSSMKQYNIEKLLPHVFGERKFFFVWGQERCWRLGDEYLKPLESVWTEFPEFDATNTLLVDDSADKCVKNPPECCLVTDDPKAVLERVKDGNAPVVNKVYTVTFTKYDDDYKSRGSDATFPVVFSRREYADEYVGDWLRKWLVDKLEDWVPEDLAKEYDVEGDFLEFVRDAAPDDVVEDIVDRHYVEGEYVPRTLVWDICTTSVDVHRVKKRRKVD